MQPVILMKLARITEIDQIPEGNYIDIKEERKKNSGFNSWYKIAVIKRQIMYHASPPEIRQSILENGLDYRIHFGKTPKPPNTRDVSFAPRGNYMSESLDQLTDYFRGELDIWEVDVTGLKLFPDQSWYHGWYTKNKIDPSKLNLIMPANVKLNDFEKEDASIRRKKMAFNLKRYLKAGLEEYKEKRDFDISPEPSNGKPDKPKSVFVVQEHHAKKAGLHYDVRLEEGGVLKSWAVRKGMPNKGEKHLAIQTEDHPYNYKDFEGTIPEGYGAGVVKIDAKSEYITVEKDNKKWKFEVMDGKYKGRWTLVNTGGNKWLLMRGKEE